MKVMDAWMLEGVQQNSRNAGTPKAGKGESFQDLMSKTKGRKLEAPEKEPVQSEKPAQKTGETRKAEAVRNADGTETRKVELDAQEAALVAAGYAKLFPQEDGTVLLVTLRDESGRLVLPLAELERANGIVPQISDVFGSTGGEWVLKPTPEFVEALKQLLQQTNDPRSLEDILSALERREQNLPAASGGSVIEVVVKTACPEQSDAAASRTAAAVQTLLACLNDRFTFEAADEVQENQEQDREERLEAAKPHESSESRDTESL